MNNDYQTQFDWSKYILFYCEENLNNSVQFK